MFQLQALLRVCTRRVFHDICHVCWRLYAALRVYIRRVFHDICHVCWRLYAALLLPRPTLPGDL